MKQIVVFAKMRLKINTLTIKDIVDLETIFITQVNTEVQHIAYVI